MTDHARIEAPSDPDARRRSTLDPMKTPFKSSTP